MSIPLAVYKGSGCRLGHVESSMTRNNRVNPESRGSSVRRPRPRPRTRYH